MNTSASPKHTAPAARVVFGDPVHLLAFGFGAGLAPKAPGTAGSIWGVLLAFATASWMWQYELALAVFITLIGIPICGVSARKLGVHDHGGIVWDEIAGAYLIFLPIPRTWPWLIAGFVTFRILDIVKPWPIRELDHRLHGGLGIMLDDVLAALIGAVILAMISGWLVP
ncbi:MAG: phosphatidylglycerophosphatase A [Pseudomonadota bacterium]